MTRLTEMWMPGNRSGDSAIAESWELIASRFRDSVRNSPAAKKVAKQVRRLVIATGLPTFAAAELTDGTDIDDYNFESDDKFEHWATKEADASGEMTLWDMQQVSFEEVVVTGNSFWIEIHKRRRNRSVTLSYQLKEWEELAHYLDQEQMAGASGNYIKNGIEYNALDEKVAYYFHSTHPYDSHRTSIGTQYSRVPASRVIHNYIPFRPSAKTGEGWLSAMLLADRDVDWYLGNELTAGAIDALLTIIHKVQNPQGRAPCLDDETKRIDPFKFGHASYVQIGLNESVEPVQSRRPGNADTGDFIDLMNRRLAMASLVSTNRLVGDPSQANLAAIKAAHEDDAGMMLPVQMHQIFKVAKPVRERFNEVGVAQSQIETVSATQFAKQRRRFQRLEAYAPGNGGVEASDDPQVAIDRMRSGLSTFQEECGRRGRNWRRNLRMMQKVNKVAEELKVTLDWTKGQGSVPDSATSIAGNDPTQAQQASKSNGSKKPAKTKP